MKKTEIEVGSNSPADTKVPLNSVAVTLEAFREQDATIKNMIMRFMMFNCSADWSFSLGTSLTDCQL